MSSRSVGVAAAAAAVARVAAVVVTSEGFQLACSARIFRLPLPKYEWLQSWLFAC